jgi:hypothetical protein
MNYDLLDTGTRSVVGDSRKIDDTTRVRRESSKFQGTGPGLDSGYRDTSLYNEEDEAGDGSGDLVSVSKEVKPGSTVTGDYERSQFYNKGYYTTRDAVATGYRSKLSEKLEYSVKGEYWYDKSSNGKDYQIGSYNNVKWLVDQDTTVKAKAYYGITFDDLISSRSAEFGEFVVGLGYRPIDNDRFNALTQYKYLLDQRPPSQYGILNGIKEDRAHIASVEGAYDINRYFQIVEKEAGKVIVDKCASDKLAVAYTNLIVNRLNYHIDDQWNIGTEYRILSEFVTKTHRTGVYVELDRNITKFMQIAVGYNFADFDDELTLNRGYTYQGWTAKLRGKY